MGTWYCHVALHCHCLSLRSTRHLLLLACSTRFQPCEQLLTAAGACAGAIVGPLFIIDHLQSTPQAAVGWCAQIDLGVGLSLGHGRPCPHHCCPCHCCPSSSPPSSWPSPLLSPCLCRCPPIPPGSSSAVLAST